MIERDRILDGMSPIELVLYANAGGDVPKHLASRLHDGLESMSSEWCDGVTMPPRLPPAAQLVARSKAVASIVPAGMSKTAVQRWQRTERRMLRRGRDGMPSPVGSDEVQGGGLAPARKSRCA